LERIISAGRQLINTSVYAWGDGSQGHLGQSDCVSRSEPSIITHLQGVGVWKIACGMHHSLALLLDGRVLAWGANGKGQVGPGQDLSFVSTPLQVTLPFLATVCDIAAGM
jgi:alpha-tubulin suppressor-like RCC1 family protein